MTSSVFTGLDLNSNGESKQVSYTNLKISSERIHIKINLDLRFSFYKLFYMSLPSERKKKEKIATNFFPDSP